MITARRAVAIGAAALAACAAGAAAGNAIAGAALRARHPVPGAFVDVDGRAMHIACTGSGAPLVLLEGGLGDDWVYWQKVQPDVARTTRVCSYDRGGVGWSAPRSRPRDAITIARELHLLLTNASESAPLVLVGASAGALYVRAFAAAHPIEVRGIVFVDGSVPEQTSELPGSRYSKGIAVQKHRDARRQWAKEASGWARITGQCGGEVEAGLDAYADLERAAACRPAYALSALAEWDDFWQSADEARAARCCGDVPLVVVSQDPDRPKRGWTADAIAAQPIWSALQERLTRLSPRSRRVIARGSGHHVMIDRPDIVVRAIQDVVDAVRDQDPATK